MPAGTLDDTKPDSSVGAQVLDDQVDDVAANADGAQSAEGAVSSPATGEQDKDLLSVVRDVVDQSRQSDTASPAGQPEVKDGSQPPENGQQPEQDAEFNDVPFNKHPRFRQLVSERNAFRDDANRYQSIQSFLRESGLPNEEAADGLITMALARTNPVEAWKRVKPWVQSLLVAAGEVLPDDLQSRVAAGEMNRETAIELSRARATTQSLTQTQQHERDRAEQARQQDLARNMQSTAATWEEQTRASDPDFEKKLPFIRAAIAERHLTQGKPDSPEGVRQELKAVYDAVSQQLRSVMPAQRQRRPITPVMGGQVATDARPAPRNTLEVIEQTVDRMRAS